MPKPCSKALFIRKECVRERPGRVSKGRDEMRKRADAKEEEEGEEWKEREGMG